MIANFNNYLIVLKKLLQIKRIVRLYINKKNFDDLYAIINKKNKKKYSLSNKKTENIDIVKIISILYQIVFVFPKNDCLKKALCFHFILMSYDITNTLYIGTKRFPFLSHAWVEDMQGNILSSSEHLCRELTIIKTKKFEGNN